jgi:excisionase family DNA binding protein
MNKTASEAATVEDIDELECLKIETLASMWDVSKRSIEKLIYEGELESHKIGGSRRIARQAAREYLKRRKVSH